eukprot:jgi/Chrzof1/2933/Cz12g04150.t1
MPQRPRDTMKAKPTPQTRRSPRLNPELAVQPAMRKRVRASSKEHKKPITRLANANAVMAVCSSFARSS